MEKSCSALAARLLRNFSFEEMGGKAGEKIGDFLGNFVIFRLKPCQICDFSKILWRFERKCKIYLVLWRTQCGGEVVEKVCF